MGARTSRRALLSFGAGTALAVLLPAHASAREGIPGRMRELEREYDARLGVFALDTATGRTVLHRADELFPICSVSKTLAVGAVLRDLDWNGEYLARRIRYTEDDVKTAGHIPITGTPENIANGLTVEELCAAAISYSDNGAMNLLLRELGGPTAVTRFCRSMGDGVTRLDRWEPDLNSAEPGRVTDTTSPRAIGQTYAQLAVGRALDPGDRERLSGWLVANTTGDARIRAGVPADWTVGDKTGTGRYGTTNDVGIAWPPNRAPIALAVLSTRQQQDAEAVDPLIAKATALAVEALS
ncbi:class A beta-lactamase [Streptomyces sp. NEAU-YJ-81]|nr:class A beta-lactamase [Streptomyces sp. NEAU-YJ-81]MBO3674468.1 class A beta-lactamase [Streptomyces sp. NEAU-YJ-81]